MKIFRILKASIRQSIIYEMQYRVNLVMNSIAGFGWTFMSFLTINIIGSNVSSIYSLWTVTEYRLLWGMNFIAEGIVSSFFKRNLEMLPDKILKGDLDFILTRPFNSKILASLGYTRIDTLLGFIFESYIVLYSLLHLNNGIPFLINILCLIILCICGSIVYYSLMISFLTFSFWLLGAFNLVYLIHQIVSFANYPINAFGRFFTILFTFIIPIAFIATFPAESLINFSPLKMVIIILVTVLIYKLSDLLWFIGLKSYSSASS